MMVLEMRSVLTPEQRAKLAQLRAERREHQRGKERHDNAQEPSPSKHETLPTEGGSPSGRSVAVNAAATSSTDCDGDEWTLCCPCSGYAFGGQTALQA